MYGAQEYLRDPLGHRPTIIATTRKQLFQIRDEVMVPSNSALIVGGDFNPKDVKQYVKEFFKDWKNPKNWKPVKRPDFPRFPKSVRFVMTRPRVKTADLIITYLGPKAFENLRQPMKAIFFQAY